MPRAEIVAVGNELLIGHTLDTNSNWMGKQFAKNGWKLQRITIVRDSLADIRSGIREALNRRPRLIVTVGGLGPTHDDMTLQGLALALRKPLVLNEKALDAVRKKYAEIDGSTALTRYRKKMATLPRGAEPLPNPVGTAPGVLTRAGQTTIVSLPGVPQEMRKIFRQSILPILKHSGLSPEEAHLNIVGVIESALAPVLSRAQSLYPGLYFKSHPKGRETGTRSLIQLHIYTTNARTQARIGDAVRYVLDSLSSLYQSQARKKTT